MNLICFVCKDLFIELDQLMVHLKYVHSLTSSSFYRCGIQHCSQTFSSYRTFSKHMKCEIFNNLNSNHNLKIINSNSSTKITNKINTNLEGVSLTHEPCDDSIDIDALKKCTLKFSAHYYGKYNFSRKEAIQLQQNVTNIITTSIAHELKKLTVDNNTMKNNALKSIIHFCENPFKELDTEYKFLKSLQINDYYEKPKIITLDNIIDDVRINNTNTVDEKKVKGVILPLKFQFRKYFEAPGILDSYIKNQDLLKNDSGLTNFINSQLWKDKMLLFNEDGIVYIPYFLYFDDFEVNNPLGSHSSSILGVYYSFPTAPEALKSNLNNIFVAALFNSKDVKYIGNDKCFYFLVDEINELQSHGINLTLNDGKQFKIKFVLGLVVGDNLGVNSVLGFARSFSSNYFCRFCISDKKSTQVLSNENTNLLRNKQNYDEHVKINNCKITGIYEESIFNKVYSFHVVTNYSVDIMHDIFEGICMYNMNHIICNLINLGFFSLETLNNRKRGFNYGDNEIGNMSPPIMQIKINTLKFKMSSREMQTFVHFFPLLVGDLVPENNQIWLFLINFIEMIDLLLLPKFNNQIILNLQKHITYHNNKYTELFQDSLKPKHHFLIHYCNIIKKSGPLKLLWCYRFESKHRQLKMYTKNITSRVQIPISLGIKYSINFSDFILSLSNSSCISKNEGSPLSSCVYFEKIKMLLSPNDLAVLDQAFCYDQIIHNNTVYKTNHILTALFDSNTLVYKLKKIICFDEKVFFLCDTLNVLSYNKHYVSYVVSSVDTDLYVLKRSTDFMGPPINLYHLNNKDTVIRLKHYFI